MIILFDNDQTQWVESVNITDASITSISQHCKRLQLLDLIESSILLISQHYTRFKLSKYGRYNRFSMFSINNTDKNIIFIMSPNCTGLSKSTSSDEDTFDSSDEDSE